MINEILDLCYKKIDIIKKSNLNENDKLKELSKLNNLIDNLKVKGWWLKKRSRKTKY